LTTEHKKIYIENLYYSLISIFGLFLLILLVFYAPNPKILYYFQKQLILSVFILICILGMVAAVSPSRCAEFLSLKHYQKSDHKFKNVLILGRNLRAIIQNVTILNPIRLV